MQAAENALTSVDRFMLTRRLITTTKGFLGAAAPETQQDDVVCVLLGCSCPLVLRPHGKSFKIVKPCYLHGIMEGEVMAWLVRGDAQLENIAIC
jgi:hypothetical protein